MKISYKFSFFILPFIFSILIISSCRKNFSLNELDHLKTDTLNIVGSFAAPLINTELTLENFIPPNDSSLWIEIDENHLIHFRMYVKDLVNLQMNQIFDMVPYPGGAGFPIPPDSTALQSDTSKMKVYTKFVDGKLFFKNPSITFRIDNAIPVVTYFKMDTVTFHNADGEAISHTSDKDYVIDAPTVLGEITHTDVVIDTTELPILPEVFSPVPKFISFYLSMGNHSMQNLPFDVTGNEQLKVDVDIDLPLDARLDTVLMTDTTNFKLTADVYNGIKSATLRIRLKNGFPLQSNTQIYFADTTDTGEIGTIVDSVFTDSDAGWVMEPAETNADGVVTIAHVTDVEIFLDQDRLNFLRDNNASKLIIVAKLNSWHTQQGQYVKILGNYKMGVRISLKVDIEGSPFNFN